MLTLNDTYEKEIKIPIRIVNIPKNVVLTSDTEDTIRIVVRDKGYMLCTYLYGDLIKRVDINFSAYSKNQGKGLISSSELLKLMYQDLYSSSKIQSVKPEKYEYYFNFGKHKRVSVKLNGSIIPEASYYIARVEFSPEQVDVYGNQAMLDSISNIFTDRLIIKNLKDTVVQEIKLQKIKGVKCIPSTVKVSVYPDILIEEVADIPITAINMPEGKTLRTFPSRVKIVFTIGASLFRGIKPENFKVIADYNDIAENLSEKCPIKIVSLPHAVKNAKTEIQQVDYLIEEQ